ncbi:MAG: radical SAM protein [Thermodesulfobacteriota bacterium]
MNDPVREQQYIPYLVAVNLTERCNLNCAHCYMDAQQRKSARENELGQNELSVLFAEIARHAPGTIIVLTGGEPLMHPEIERIVISGVEVGLRMVLGTNGVLLTEPAIKKFKKIGLSGVGISLDSIYEDQHDSFRGVSGSFTRSCNAVRLCKSNGLHVQLHFTVTSSNYRQLKKVVGLGSQLGASIINFFFLVCVGRGKSYLDIPPDLYEKSLKEIAELQESSKGIMIQSRCTPHFKRILYENNPDSPYTRATGYDGGGCPAATHYCRITPTGEVTPCPYIELSAGSIRERSFWEIWQNAQLFKSFRNPELLEGRCGRCEFKLLCGGCRARSLVQSGSLMAEDPNCSYIPRGREVIAVQSNFTDSRVEWTPEAKERLKKIPIFLRGLIKKRLEERARTEGTAVTVALMKKHKEEREKELGIKFR